jgi:hypothetical protein
VSLMSAWVAMVKAASSIGGVLRRRQVRAPGVQIPGDRVLLLRQAGQRGG